MAETEIAVPRDRQASFDSIILPKHKRDVSDIENKVLAMYTRSMSQRDISATIDDIYGFKLNAKKISKITDYVLEEQEIGYSCRRTQESRCSRLHFYGRRIRFGSGRTKVYCPSDLQLAKVRADARFQGLHLSLEKKSTVHRASKRNVLSPTSNNFLITRRRGAKLCTRPMPLRRSIPVWAR